MMPAENLSGPARGAARCVAGRRIVVRQVGDGSTQAHQEAPEDRAARGARTAPASRAAGRARGPGGDGGGGLIGWTPLPAGYVTGNPTADLQTQLNAILTFNQIWAQYIPTLNAAASPAQAADIYVTDFERAGIPAYSRREAAAEAVAAACGL